MWSENVKTFAKQPEFRCFSIFIIFAPNHLQLSHPHLICQQFFFFFLLGYLPLLGLSKAFSFIFVEKNQQLLFLFVLCCVGLCTVWMFVCTFKATGINRFGNMDGSAGTPLFWWEQKATRVPGKNLLESFMGSLVGEPSEW